MIDTTHTSFPRLNRGTGAQWMTREDAEQLARASNLHLANGNGVALTRSPNGPLMDIYGLNAVSVFEDATNWYFRAGGAQNKTEAATKFMISASNISLPKSTTTSEIRLYLWRVKCQYNFGEDEYYFTTSNADATIAGGGVSSEKVAPGAGAFTYTNESLFFLAQFTIASGALTMQNMACVYAAWAWVYGYRSPVITWNHSLGGADSVDFAVYFIGTNGGNGTKTLTLSGTNNGFLRLDQNASFQLKFDPAATISGPVLARVQTVDGKLVSLSSTPYLTIPSGVSGSINDGDGITRSFQFGVRQS